MPKKPANEKKSADKKSGGGKGGKADESSDKQSKVRLLLLPKSTTDLLTRIYYLGKGRSSESCYSRKRSTYPL